MITFDIDMKGVIRHKQIVNSMNKHLKATPEKIMNTAGRIIVSEARLESARKGIKTHTGRYLRGWHYRVEQNVLHIRNRSNHAVYIEGGTRPHVIEPRRRRALRFVIGGTLRFAKKVFHPGTRAYRVLESAIEKSWPRIYKEISVILKEAVERGRSLS